jgi:hypothetical protein
MPQLDLVTFLSQVLYLFFFLLIAYYFLSVFILQKIVLILKYNIKKYKLYFNIIVVKMYQYQLLLLLLNKQILDYISFIYLNVKNIILQQYLYLYDIITNLNSFEE